MGIVWRLPSLARSRRKMKPWRAACRISTSRPRDTSGRSAALDGAAFTRTANQMLDEGLACWRLAQAIPTIALRRSAFQTGRPLPFDCELRSNPKRGLFSAGTRGRATNDGFA